MMLSESYFNGDRLRAYLAILKDYEESSKSEMFEAVQVNDTAVINVSVVEEKVIPTVLENVKIEETEDEMVYDFSDVCIGSVLVSVCENRSDVNHYVKDYSVIKKKKFDNFKRVRCVNGTWSKEISNVGSFYVSITPKVIPRRLKGPLEDIRFNNPICFSSYRENKRKLWLEYRFYPDRWFDDLHLLNNAEFDYYDLDVRRRVMVINDRGTLIVVMRGNEACIIATNLVGIPIFVCEGEIEDKRILIYEMLNWNGRCVKSHTRHLRENYMNQLISQFDSRGNNTFYIKPKITLYSPGVDDMSILCVGKHSTYNVGHRVTVPPLKGYRLKMFWEDTEVFFRAYDSQGALLDISALETFKHKHNDVVFLADFSCGGTGSCTVHCVYNSGILSVVGFGVGPVYKEGANLTTPADLRAYDNRNSTG